MPPFNDAVSPFCMLCSFSVLSTKPRRLIIESRLSTRTMLAQQGQAIFAVQSQPHDPEGAVAGVVGNRGDVVSGLFNEP